MLEAATKNRRDRRGGSGAGPERPANRSAGPKAQGCILGVPEGCGPKPKRYADEARGNMCRGVGGVGRPTGQSMGWSAYPFPLVFSRLPGAGYVWKGGAGLEVAGATGLEPAPPP